MRWIALVVGVMLLTAAPMNAQDSTASYWFSLSEGDPTPVTNVQVAAGDTMTLHAWMFVDAPNWGWIGGFTFPIWFDTLYLNAIDAGYDDTNMGPYMFKGVNWPDNMPEYPGQALWYAAVCFSGCMNADSTAYHLGYISFEITQPTIANLDSVMVIDTLMYPPSNYATMGDETGTKTVWPEWHPLYISGPVQVEENTSVPRSFFMNQVGPNPFRGATSISFGLPTKAQVNISLYDVTGRLVRTLVSGIKDAGTYTIEWDGRDNTGRSLSSGAYFLRMTTEDYQSVKRLLILR